MVEPEGRYKREASIVKRLIEKRIPELSPEDVETITPELTPIIVDFIDDYLKLPPDSSERVLLHVQEAHDRAIFRINSMSLPGNPKEGS